MISDSVFSVKSRLWTQQMLLFSVPIQRFNFQNLRMNNTELQDMVATPAATRGQPWACTLNNQVGPYPDVVQRSLCESNRSAITDRWYLNIVRSSYPFLRLEIHWRSNILNHPGSSSLKKNNFKPFKALWIVSVSNKKMRTICFLF